MTSSLHKSGDRDRRSYPSPLDQLIALLAVIGIHVFLFFVLAETDGESATPIHPRDARTALVLLDSPDIEVPRSPVKDLSAPIQMTREVHDAPSAPLRAVGVTAPQEGPARSMANATDTALDLSVEASAIEFSAHSLQRPVSPQFATAAPLLQLRFEDPSLIGKMARMSRNVTCSELQHALASHPESAESIVNTMKQRGCAR